ncbi:MAG TPA: phosphate ABC transporter substrate-binding protein PstS [Bryobacteraceae bacterium]|jgi:phosphate transport system substrate-binding protein
MMRSQRRKLAITTFLFLAACAGRMPAGAATSLRGAGATFPAPIYAKWFASYRERNPEVEITYDAVGSEAGVQKLLAGGVEFGASDNPEILRELAPNDQAKYLFFPSVAGAVVPIVNLPGIPSELSFTPETLAGIYLGKITKWNDPLLRKANPHLHLPDLDITVVHRADGSGTSYAWSDYLSKTNPEWKARVGTGMAPKWPVGRAANGNDGVAKVVKEFGGSIGYVEFIYALQNHLSFGKIRNHKSEFVAADLESISAAVTHSVALNSDFKGSIVDAPGAGAYPIASFTWFVVPARIGDEAKRKAVVEFLTWMLGEGQRQAAAVGYVALPREIVSREKAAVTLIQPGIH